jgi:branched-chain amino acid transport system ATP-binding protein
MNAEDGSPILEAAGVSKHYGGLDVLTQVNLVVPTGAVTGLIGPNGAGKTTLFDIISAITPADAGTMRLYGHNGAVSLLGLPPHRVAALGVARTFQNLRLFDDLSVADNVLVGRHLHHRQGVLNTLWPQRRIRQADAKLQAFVQELLAFVGLSGTEATRADHLAYGERKRLEIARALAAEPRLLLLDEPTAGMNPSEKETIRELVASVVERGTSVLIVEHDIRLVMDLSAHVVVLHHGAVLAAGAPDIVRNDPQVAEVYLGSPPST